MLTQYAAYYNELRTHRSLGKDAPIHRAIQHRGRITSVPVLGGLHPIIAESNFRYRQGHCAGRPMRGINVIYLPRSGFTGVDVVQYTVKFTVISQTVDVDISVQSDQATRGNVGVPPSSEDDPQTQGPIPICVPPGLLGKQRCVA